MFSLSWGCIVAVGVAGVTSQTYTVFRPQGYSSLQPLPFGRGPDPLHIVQHLTQVQAESDLCLGVNDVLAVTLTAPIVGDISPENIELLFCYSLDDYDHDSHPGPPSFDECYIGAPACAHLQLEDDPKERRTLLLFGQFVKFQSQLAVSAMLRIALRHVTEVVDGKQPHVYGEYPSGQGFAIQQWERPKQPVLGYGQGPFLADISLLDLAAPPNTAAADPNGCAALHPSATYAVRLLFASAVHERAADGSLAPFGTNATAAAALFSPHCDYGDGAGVPAPDRVVGVAAVPGGSVVDVCFEAAAGEPQVEAVVINCTAAAPRSPAGFPCTTPIKAFLRSWEDERAGRDPSTFAGGHTIEFCLSDPEDCPGAASDYSDYSHDDGGDDHDSSGRNKHDGLAGSGLGSFAVGAGITVAVVAALAGLGAAGYL